MDGGGGDSGHRWAGQHSIVVESNKYVIVNIAYNWRTSAFTRTVIAMVY